MKIIASTWLAVLATANAFTIGPFQTHTKPTSSSLQALSTATAARDNLKRVADTVAADKGIFLYDSNAKSNLEKAVSELEAVAEPPSQQDFDEHFRGDWKLICTTTTNAPGVDTTKLPFFDQGFLKEMRGSLNRRVRVLQVIKSTKGDDDEVDRIDNVIEYEPPKSVQDVFGTVPEALSKLSVNPLELSKAKVTLIHKAKVESVVPKLTTKIKLTSSVLNVAGTSQLLKPDGADVLGLNFPLSELLTEQPFETTYMDDEIRVSRGKQGFRDQLRVFQKVKPTSLEDDLKEAMSKVDYVEKEEEEGAANTEFVDDGSPSD